VAGAIYSGVAMVVTLLVPIRKLFRLEELITVHHFENLAKLCLLTGMIVAYAYCVEYFTAWFGGNANERAAFWYRAFGPFWWASWGIMAGSFGWFFMWFLLFVKNFPSVSISEVKEVLPPPQRASRAVHA